MADAPDLGALLLEGHELISRTSDAHRERWGLGKADRWNLDQRDGRLVWSFTDGHRAHAEAQVLGSWNGKVSTFAWAWDNETVLEPLRRTAEQVRAFGVEHGVAALTSSPLSLAEEQVRDLVALAFRVTGSTGLYHPFDGTLATYLVFGPVTVEQPDGSQETFTVPAS